MSNTHNITGKFVVFNTIAGKSVMLVHGPSDEKKMGQVTYDGHTVHLNTGEVSSHMDRWCRHDQIVGIFDSVQQALDEANS